MNFQELMSRIAELDQPVAEELKGGQTKLDVDKDGDIEGDDLADLRAGKKDEKDLDECGMMPSMSSSQPDNVNVSINMNGSGKGGIRDLLDILRNIEDGGDDAGDLGDLIGKMDKEPIIGSDMPVDEFANKPNPETAPMSRMVATGNDLLSKGAEAPKVNGGGNPRGTPPMEDLVARLESLYQEVKGR